MRNQGRHLLVTRGLQQAGERLHAALPLQDGPGQTRNARDAAQNAQTPAHELGMRCRAVAVAHEAQEGRGDLQLQQLIKLNDAKTLTMLMESIL